MDAVPDKSRYDASEVGAIRALVSETPRTFSLNLAVCDDPALRDLLVRQLDVDFPAIEIVSLWPYESDVFEHVRAAISDAPKDALFVAGVDDALNADIDRPALLRSLDASPERWKAWFACPVIFWVDAHTADILRQQARDFWEWQTHIFRLDP